MWICYEAEIVGLRDRQQNLSRTSQDIVTPTSRPVYMLSRRFNLNPVIDARFLSAVPHA